MRLPLELFQLRHNIVFHGDRGAAMTLHEYAITGHNRSDIGRWLGIASVLLAPLITNALISLGLAYGTLTTFTVSSGLVYITIYWLFNSYGWICLDRFLHIPNLSGTWNVLGATKNLDGTTRFEWQGELVISQKWDRIAIELRTGTSSSYSETASLLLKHDGNAKLSYSYQNHPRSGEAELQKHQGFCELIFDHSCQNAEGHYFNSLGRYTFGHMLLTKV